jgi:hypothetical protein
MTDAEHREALNTMLDRLEAMSGESKAEFWGILDPETKAVLEQMQTERALRASIMEATGFTSITFASEEDPDDSYTVNLVTGEHT